ncbi:MAG: hypothetical protein WDW38_007954 [Sanguina aurantia]
MHKCRLKTSAQNADVTLLLKPKQQLSENQRPQEAQGGAYQTVNPMPHPESASSPLRANGVLPLINRRQLVVGAVASTAAATCQCCKEPFAQASEWAYGDVSGPPLWPGTCSTGIRQSPIDISLGNLPLPAADDFRFAYTSAFGLEVLNTGHGTMQVIFPAGNIAYIDGRELELLQFHFHTPSEHAINGRRFPMEAHLVHKDKATGGLAVLGVLIQPGGVIQNPALQAALESASQTPLERTTAKRQVTASALLPKRGAGQHRPFVRYAGSLTTPPCSESVDWFLYTEPISVPDSQVIAFLRFVGGGKSYATNARPLQPLNGRQVEFDL